MKKEERVTSRTLAEQLEEVWVRKDRRVKDVTVPVDRRADKRRKQDREK